MNVEHRTPNIEHRMNEFCLFKKRVSAAIPSLITSSSGLFCRKKIVAVFLVLLRNCFRYLLKIFLKYCISNSSLPYQNLFL